jgi:beta-galactosidase
MNTRPLIPTLVFSLLLATVAAAKDEPSTNTAVPASPLGARLTFPLDSAWTFHRADIAGADAIPPAVVDLPHDWSIAGPFDADAPAKRGGAYLPTGTAQYRKFFTLPASDKGKHVEIVFDGIAANGEVFINGHSLGSRPSPYVSVHYDLTPYLKFGDAADGRNVIDVNVNNGIQPTSRYYTGSGIERHVRLVITNPVHVETWGLYVTTPEVSPEKATVHLQTTVTNSSDKAGAYFVQGMVHDGDGRMVGASVKSAPQTIAAGQSATFEQDIPVTNPKLWDLSSPNLYKAVVAVVNDSTAGGGTGMMDTRSVDVDSATFGIRKAEFKPETGFWLNGKNIKILGVCIHEDGGAVGEAVPRSVYEERIGALKALGANALRLAHNPPNPVELDVCDKLGMLVMDEMFDAWTVGKPNAEQGYNLYFTDWSLRDLHDAVMRDRNHPSIILWSAGNEIHDTPQEAKAKNILQGLVAEFHKADPSRPVTQALFRPGTSHDYTNGLADMLDVIGTNYRDTELVAAQQAVPTRKVINTEERQDAKTWVYVRDTPQLAGCFIWSGVEYLGEGFVAARPAGVDDPGGAWPNISSPSGLYDRTLNAKPAAMERESWWSTKPVTHIIRSTDRPTARSGNTVPTGTSLNGLVVGLPDWTPNPANTYTDATVYVVSNCEEVELFLNGQSLGIKPLSANATPRQWEVPYAPGELKAVGRNGGKEVSTDILQTAGKPAKLVLTADRTSATPTFDDVVFVRATVTDDKGVRIPFADDAITFQVSGPGKFVAGDNGKPDDHTVFSSPTRTAKDGRVLGLVRATDGTGKITVTATAEGLQPGTLTLTATPAAN